MDLLKFVVLALMVETVWETAKMVWENGKLSVDRIGAMAVGLLLAISTGMDFFAAVGFKMSIPYLGVILSGLLISRGANFLHDLIGSVQNLSK